MFIIKPHIFNRFSEIIFGLSTKVSENAKPPFYFNLSYSVGDDLSVVDENRKGFFSALELNSFSVAYQKQIHSDIIKVIDCGGDSGESDALITDKTGLGLAVSVADCTPIFIYDHKKKIIAAVHSGWRGTEKKILKKTLITLNEKYKSEPDDLFTYIGPSISQANYEVGKEVAQKFDNTFVKTESGKHFLDVSGINLKMLIDFGIPQNQIQRSLLCTYEFNNLLHSYRRDGDSSGRMFGVIAIR